MIHNKYFEVMKRFLKGYCEEIYGRELVGKVKISQKNIALTLNELENEDVLSSKMKGNLRYYSLNRQNPLIKQYLILFEIQKSIDFLKNNPKINLIFDKFDKKGAILCIFGSYAKGIQKKDSDLDVFAVGDVNEKEIKKIGETYKIDLSIKSGSYPDFIDLLKKKNPLINEILENHVIIFGHEKFIDEVIKQIW